MSTPPQYIVIYVTCQDKAEATTIASAALLERLAACANILDNMESMYWWQGELVRDNECVLLFKSELRLFEPLKKKILELHSYKTPCVVALPITAGSRDYLNWISAETAHQ